MKQESKREDNKAWNNSRDMWFLIIILAVSLSAWIAASSLAQVLSYLAPMATALSIIGIILRLILAPIERQVYNHLPTANKEIKSEIKALSHIPIEINVIKEGQKEIKADQSKMRSELRNDIEKLDKKFDQTNQKIEQNYKDMTAQNIQNFKDMTTQNNQNFKELVSLITKQRTGT